MYLIRSPKIFIRQKFTPATLLIKDEKIAAILPYDYVDQSLKLEQDYTDLIIPGLIDIHNHGMAGWSFTGALTDEDFLPLTKRLASVGITSLLATTAFSGYPVLVRNYERPDLAVSILGLHAEGPFLNDAQPGAAFPFQGFPAPSLAKFKQMVAVSQGSLKYLTIAVELPETLPILKYAKDNGVLVAVGHSEASYADIIAKADYLSAFTHVGNAMKGIHHRAVGTFGAGLLMDDLWVELIGDGLHLAPETLQIIYRIKPHQKMILVSDFTALAGLPAGQYQLPSNLITISEQGLITNEAGRLGGSSFSVLAQLRYLWQEVKFPLTELIPMATSNPAELLGCSDLRGEIATGKFADLLIVDQALQLQKTIHHGQIVYQAEDKIQLSNAKLEQLLHNPEFLNYYQ